MCTVLGIDRQQNTPHGKDDGLTSDPPSPDPDTLPLSSIVRDVEEEKRNRREEMSVLAARWRPLRVCLPQTQTLQRKRHYTENQQQKPDKEKQKQASKQKTKYKIFSFFYSSKSKGQVITIGMTRGDSP